MKKEAIFLTHWKDEMKNIIKLRYGKLNKEKVDEYLDKLIAKHMKNPKAIIDNNYRHIFSNTDVLSVIDLIEEKQLIIGGGGVLFQQHNLKDNPLIAYITNEQGKRDLFKAHRALYKKGSDEWFAEDIGQGNTKKKINSLYGVHGYFKFILFNIFIAEAITNQGRQIICSAAEGFENFLMDNVYFATQDELFHYIYNIINEYHDKYKDKMEFTPFHLTNSKHRVVKRLINKCGFVANNNVVMHVEEIVKELSEDELTLLFYKNNLYEMNKHPIIKDKLGFIINNLDQLYGPSLSLIKDEGIKQLVLDVWDIYRVFVLYDYPIFDRVRKTMYTNTKAVLYIDTDSNFISMNRWVEYIKRDVLNNKMNKPEGDIDFIAVNLCTFFIGNVVDSVLQTLCKSMNVTPEFAKRLRMKNEFYMQKILFTDSKKRYISYAVLQEGKIIEDERERSEIKGFDFKKSTVKPFVTEYFTKICLDDILKVKEIDIKGIFKKMLDLRKDIEDSMRNGESKYYKQANIRIIEHYAYPYSIQGIRAVILWNTLCPDYQMELPIDVDLVPIKDLSDKKVLAWFEEKFPSEYIKLKQNILNNPLYIKKPRNMTSDREKEWASKPKSVMNLNYIAKPKNYDKEFPEWFSPLVDTEKVVADTLSLFYPILQSLGLNTLKTSSSDEHLSNVINL